MKKMLKYTVVALLALVFSACEKEPIPVTSTVDLAGEWMVTATVGGEPVYGPFMVLTYNTSDDNGTELWINELNNFWNPSLKVKVPCNAKAQTFGADKDLVNANQPSGQTDFTVKVTNGKVTYNGTKTPSGKVADAIEYTVEYSDDPGTHYVFKGYRRTGLVEDE